jgi:hypothetical protein
VCCHCNRTGAGYAACCVLDANSADALLGLAVINFGSSNVQEVRRRAVFCAAGLVHGTQVISFCMPTVLMRCWGWL